MAKRVNADTLKRLAELVDGDTWQIADLLVEEFPEQEFGGLGGAGISTGLYEKLTDYEHALVTDYGIELKASTMRRYRTTAIAWPNGVRTPFAPFAVCNRFHGADRFKRIDSYLKRNKGRPLTVRAVRRYTAEDGPLRPLPPWEQQVRRRIESAAKAALLEGIKTDRDDWWNAQGIDDGRRKVVIDALRKLATAMGS